jgi:hypothetical protein
LQIEPHFQPVGQPSGKHVASAVQDLRALIGRAALASFWVSKAQQLFRELGPSLAELNAVIEERPQAGS